MYWENPVPPEVIFSVNTLLAYVTFFTFTCSMVVFRRAWPMYSLYAWLTFCYVSIYLCDVMMMWQGRDETRAWLLPRLMAARLVVEFAFLQLNYHIYFGHPQDRNDSSPPP
jgi:hypothetical protein